MSKNSITLTHEQREFLERYISTVDASWIWGCKRLWSIAGSLVDCPGVQYAP